MFLGKTVQADNHLPAMAAKQPRVLLADDHVILLEAFKKLLEPVCVVVGTVTDGRALVDAAFKLKPDIVVADINMPRLNGLDACEQLKPRLPQTKLIFLTVSEDPETAIDAIRRGASGYLLKKSAATELFEAIQKVSQGLTYLTPFISREPVGVFFSKAKNTKTVGTLTLRQREVLQLLAEGRSMKEAADVLHVTARTIAFHKYSMMEQLRLKTTAELIRHATDLGLVSGHMTPIDRVASSFACQF
jgi:DNA-binding NarL/FixJ family response regulator